MTTTTLIKNLPRIKEIVSVAAKFGFGEIIRDTKLATFLEKFKKLHDSDKQPAPVRFRLALEALGPTFMKLGQVLSMRPDLVPPAWSEELANLQDSCPVVPWDEIQKILMKGYNNCNNSNPEVSVSHRDFMSIVLAKVSMKGTDITAKAGDIGFAENR